MDSVANFIGNAYVPTSGGTSYELVSPVDGTVTATVHEAGPSGGRRGGVGGEACAARSVADDERRPTVRPPVRRREGDHPPLRRVRRGRDGRHRPAAPRHDAGVHPARCGELQGLCRSSSERGRPRRFVHGAPGRHGALNYAMRKPKGVIGVVCPWNAPFLLMTWKVAPALACGNAVVVKPSEETPRPPALLGEVMNASASPPGVYNVVTASARARPASSSPPTPTSTRSRSPARPARAPRSWPAASEGVRDVSFELGGKNSGIVFADADFDARRSTASSAPPSSTPGRCASAPSACTSSGRSSSASRRARRAGRASVQYGRPGTTTTTYGPLISHEHREKVLGYYRRAVEDGATVVTGGGVPDVGRAGGRRVGAADDLDRPARRRRGVHEEVFGPCCHVRPFDTEDEVIGLANDTDVRPRHHDLDAEPGACAPRGRSASRSASPGSTAGSCATCAPRSAAAKQSGIGREGGVHSLEFYTETKQRVCEAVKASSDRRRPRARPAATSSTTPGASAAS
jgi:aminomuconate-semialdehyde/2-hydroxymuconate-6-semialdehyde dehydrogenase